VVRLGIQGVGKAIGIFERESDDQRLVVEVGKGVRVLEGRRKMSKR
jgi:hypothetical protein